MFKRRNPRSYGRMASDMIYPRGGWVRAATYNWHRLRRLPDQPHRIGRGAAAGVFISFTPLFGFHFLGGAAVGWLIRGNILAALLGTFIGNPLTIPFIAMLSLTSGRWLLGLHGDLSPQNIFGEFAQAGEEVYNNLLAPFGPRIAHWDQLSHFLNDIYWPYMLGGIIWGTVAGVITHYLTVPVIKAYHKRRAKKMEARIARARSLQATRTRQPVGGQAAPPPPQGGAQDDL